MSDTTSGENLLRAWTHPVYGIALPPNLQLPGLSLLAPMPQVPEGHGLPGANIFAGMTPQQAMWFQHLMGQGVGQPPGGGVIDPYWAMQMLGGDQSAVQASGAEQEPGF